MKAETITEKKNISWMKRTLLWVRNLFIIGLVLIFIILMAGIVYEKYSEYIDSKKYTPPGKIIEISRHDMHIFAKGSGKATVVFASGWGIPCPYAEYYPLYNEIAKHSRIVVYDRPGYGWSEVTNTPREIDSIVKEIHELLVKSGEKPPYVFVGHSLASLEVVRFAQMYENEVKGIVMLDAGNPDYYSKESLNDNSMSALSLKSVLNNTGVFRLLFNNLPSFYASVYAPRNSFSLVPEDLKRLDTAMYLRNMVSKNKNDEISNIKINALDVVAHGTLNNIPLRILTSEIEAKDLKWKDSQEAFKNWSSNSKQMIVKGTNHNMQQYKPDVINKEILDVLNKIK